MPVLILLAIVAVVLVSCVKVVPQAKAYVLERLEDTRQHGELVSILKCHL